MSITDWPTQERPREKLLAQGAEALSDAELIAIFLRTGVKGLTAVDLARNLITEFGNIRQLLKANAERFCQKPGLGITKYTQLQAALELGRRHLHTTLDQQNVLKSPGAVKSYLITQLRDQLNETFACLYLNNRHHVISFEKLFHGTINQVNVHPRIIVKRALEHHAAALILAHNHPSGHPMPSQLDINLTLKAKQVLDIVDIRLLDHLIIGESSVYSMAEEGIF